MDLLILRDARSVIGDVETHPLVLAENPQGHAAVRSIVFDGIGRQVGQHFFHASLVGQRDAGHAVARLDHQSNLVLLGDQLQVLDDLLRDVLEIDEFLLERNAFGVEARHVQQVLDQRGQAGAGPRRIVEGQVHVGAHLAVGHGFQAPADRRHRGAQFMRGDEQELILELEDFVLPLDLFLLRFFERPGAFLDLVFKRRT